jgi:hypothetical protein
MSKLNMRRVPHRYRWVLVSVVQSVCMSAVVSLIVTIRNVGMCGDMPGLWLAAWQVSCAIAVPARFAVAPMVSRFVGALVEPPPAQHSAG